MINKLIIGAMSLLLLTSCTTEYLDDRTIGYDGREEDDHYKPIKRKSVTVKEPLIENMGEPAPDLIALPVDKVDITEIDKKENNNMLSSDIKIGEAILLPEEDEKIEETPPLEAKIAVKEIKPADVDNSMLDEADNEPNILSLLGTIGFYSNSTRLGKNDYKIIKEAALIQNADGGRLKVITYAPLGNKIGTIYKIRNDKVIKAINENGVKANMIIALIEQTNDKDLFNKVEIYIESAKE